MININTNIVSISTYSNMNESEKQNFYTNIVESSNKTKKTTRYCTVENPSKQARIPNFLFHQEQGNLTFVAPLKRIDIKKTSLFFLAICDCGEWVILEGNSFRKESQTKCNHCSHQNGNHIKDISGQVYGQLKALYPTNKRGKEGSVIWMCECIECGHKQEVIKYNLRKNGHLCLVCNLTSKGEYLVSQLLKQNNIEFVREKTFENCKYPHSGNSPKFDFYINNQYIVEIDGEHHFAPQKFNSDTTEKEAQERFIKQQIRDNYKNNYCKENNIPLIRIPYFYYNSNGITLEDISLESSKFLV